MLNTCRNCGRYSVEKEIAGDGTVVKCPFCGNAEEIKRQPLFIVTGASGSGKSSVCAELFKNETDYIVMESDILWQDSFNEPDTGYSRYRALWLRLCKNISQIGKPVVLCGCAVPEQFEEQAERRYFTKLHYISLVCEEEVLRKRLVEEQGCNNQEYVEVSVEFNEWIKKNAHITKPEITVLDNTKLSKKEAADAIHQWIMERIS